jgi:hypothetical protein
MDPEADAGSSGDDDVVRDEVVVSLFDADAVAASRHAICGDHTSAPWAEDDADASWRSARSGL